MRSVSQVRMKPECLPKKFEFQPYRKKRISDTVKRPYVLQKQRMMAVEECEKQLQESSTVPECLHISEASVSSVQSEEIVQDCQKFINKSVQVCIIKKFRSKAIQTDIKAVHQSTSPLKPHLQSVSTSPFKMNSCVNVKPSKPSKSLVKSLFKKEDQSDSDTSYTSSHPDSSPSTESPQILSPKSMQKESASNCSEMIEDDEQQVALKN